MPPSARASIHSLLDRDLGGRKNLLRDVAQPKPEHGARPGCALEAHFPPVRLDDLSGEHEAQAGAGDAVRCRISAEELREDLRVLLPRDYEALVAYGDGDPAVFARDRDVHGSALG